MYECCKQINATIQHNNYHICRRVQTSLDVLQLVQLVQHNISNRSSLGVERDIAVLQEFLIPGVLWGYFECIHFSEIIMVLLNHLILFPQYYSGVGEEVIARKSQYLKELYFVILNPVPELFHFQYTYVRKLNHILS